MSDYKLSAVLELRDNLTKKIKSARDGLQGIQSTARSASGSIDGAAASMARAGTAASKLQQNLRGLKGNYSPTISLKDQITNKLGKVKQELKGLTNKAYTATVNIRQSGALGRLRGSLSEMASGAMMGLPMQMAGAAGIGYGIYDTLKVYKDFEQQMAAVRAIATSDMGAAEADAAMKELTAKAREMGAQTQFTAAEAGKAFEYMGMAGWRKEQMLAGIQPILDLALASREDLGRVSDIVTDAMTALKIDTKGVNANANIQQFTDVLASAATHSNTTVGMMGEAFKYGASIAGLFTDSYKNAADITNDVALALSLMADSGIKGSQAGTAFRAMLSRMTSDSIQTAQAMSMLGVDILRVGEDGVKELKPLRDIFGEIREKMKNGLAPEQLIEYAETMTGTKTRNKDRLLQFANTLIEQGGKLNAKDQAKFAKMFEGEEGLSGWIALMTADEATYQQRIRDLDNSKGAAAKMSETIADTMEGDLKRIQSAWNDFQIELMTGKGAEGIRGFLQSVTEDINIFKDALKDGFDISDIGKVAMNVIKQLKDKFLEMNGVGSLLAGGALALGLYKIVSLSKSAFSSIGSLVGGLRGGKTDVLSTAAGGLGASSMGSMTVNAATVVVNGKAVAGGGAAVGGPGADVTTSPTQSGRGFRANRGMIAAGTAIAATVGVMDVMATRSQNGARSTDATTWLKDAENHLQDIENTLEDLKNDSEATEEDIKAAERARDAAKAEVDRMRDYQKDVEKQNSEEMAKSVGGAFGATAGTVIGGALGSLAGPVGTQIGMTVGGILGEVIGTKMGELANEKPSELLKEIGPTVQDEFGNDVAIPGAEVSAAEGMRALREETTTATQAIEDEMQMEVDSIENAWQMVRAASAESTNQIKTDFKDAATANSEAVNAVKDESVAASSEVKSAWSGIGAWIASLFSFGGGGVAHNASGTSYFGGGWTEINEHGGEIVDLPGGSRIYPYATTMGMLENIFGGSDNGSSDYVTQAPVINISGNSFTVREEADINRIAHELMRLIQQASGNYNYVGG